MTMNRLAGETSPYLLQHADNPVDWRPWNAEALTEARQSGRPILLSVGYAACHWCHVMAHESFENEAIAAQMNADFVPIKVDREERPDLDQIYQAALAMLGQQGGWPLTMFLTPEGEPFWGGTYFPPEPRWGRPGFPDVLRAVIQVWRDEPDRVRHNVGALTEGLRSHATARPGPEEVPDALLDRIAERFLESFDAGWGGLRGAPKFPQPAILELLWRFWRRTGTAVARDRVLRSLEAMAEGGIYDHVGGGFARYSTDEQWLVPHFEKMLYDNAELTRVMTLVWRTTRDPLLARRVEETIGWVLREMRVEGGAFAASLDADSEGEEGRFYVWTEAEIDEALGVDGPAFKRAYEVTPEGNWEGGTILNRRLSPGWRGDEEEVRLASLCSRLLTVREARERPGRDDKVLADWNGLMIAAMAEAGAVFARPDWVDSAAAAYDAIGAELRTPDGRLLHSWRGGRARHLASIDDLAAMIRAALALHEARGEPRFLDDAAALAQTAWLHHWDETAGGHFFTADDAEPLIVRPKSVGDHATPSGNAMMVENLARLFIATGDRTHADRRDRLIAAFSGEIERNLFGLGTFLNGAEASRRLVEIVVVGQRGDGDADALVAEARRTPLIDRAIRLVEPGFPLPEAHPAVGKSLVDGRPAAYVCRDFTCLPPVVEPDQLARILGEQR